MTRALIARLDSAGDVLLAGPAVRAVAAHVDEVVMLVGPRGADAAELLPGVGEVLVWNCPWIVAEPPAVLGSDVMSLVQRLTERSIDHAFVLTSWHQCPLPLALLLRMAGVRSVAAISDDYPGSLLDLRHRVHDGLPEPERNLSLVAAAGFEPAPDDDGRLRVVEPLPDMTPITGDEYVVVHPGTSAPARAWSPRHWRALVRRLHASGSSVVVTGGPDETALTSEVAGGEAIDLGGRTTLRELAGVLQGARYVIVGNTGPAHLAAATGAKVVSLFAPTVPASAWAPYGVAVELLGDQRAACAGSRAVLCEVPGHPCLDDVLVDDVLAAAARLGAA